MDATKLVHEQLHHLEVAFARSEMPAQALALSISSHPSAITFSHYRSIGVIVTGVIAKRKLWLGGCAPLGHHP